VIFKGSGWYVTDYARKNNTFSENGSRKSEESGTSAEATAETTEKAPKAEESKAKEP
jgi:predicted nucleic acid-binding Zn ribbon protein